MRPSLEWNFSQQSKSQMKISESLDSGQRRSQFITTASLKVTLSVSCGAGTVPGFISRAEWQIQHNASSHSKHFTPGPSMWPWFRWMSTSHLYSSNQRFPAQRHMHAATPSRPPSPSSPPVYQPAMLITQLRRVRDRNTETPDTGDIHSPTPGCSIHASSLRVGDPGSSCLALALHSAREVWSDRPPDSDLRGPQHALTQCRCWVFLRGGGASKEQVGGSEEGGGAREGNVSSAKTRQGFNFASNHFPHSNCELDRPRP